MLCPYHNAQRDEVHVPNDTAKVVWDEVLADVRTLMTTFRAKANPPLPPFAKGGMGGFQAGEGVNPVA